MNSPTELFGPPGLQSYSGPPVMLSSSGLSEPWSCLGCLDWVSWRSGWLSLLRTMCIIMGLLGLSWVANFFMFIVVYEVGRAVCAVEASGPSKLLSYFVQPIWVVVLGGQIMGSGRRII